MLISPALAAHFTPPSESGGSHRAIGYPSGCSRVLSCLLGPEEVAQAQAKARWHRQIAVYEGWGRLSPGEPATASCEA